MKHHFSPMAALTVKPLVQGLFLQPFVLDMIDGTLSRERFLYYIQQDSLFLISFGRALALTAGKLSAASDMALMLRSTAYSLSTVTALHDRYKSLYPFTADLLSAPAAFSYSAHILERAALGVPTESLAALLPRFWIFRDISNHIRSLADSDNPWFAWIETFSSSDYSDLVEQMGTLVDRLAASLPDESRHSVLQAYIASCRFEYMLCDDAYNLRAWPA